MAVPDFQSLMLPLLRLAEDGQEHTLAEAIQALADQFSLSEEDRAELLPSGKQARFNNRVGWAATYLKKAGLLKAVGHGRFQVTDRGSGVLSEAPSAIDIGFLEGRFPELGEFRRTGDAETEDQPATFDAAAGRWIPRAGVEDRIREKLELSISNEETRRQAVELMAFAIENADEEREDAWYLRETSHGIALVAARLQACKLTRKTSLSVMGPVDDHVRETLGVDAANDDGFKSIPGGVMLTFPVERAGDALRLLRDAFNTFVDLAVARVRRSVSIEEHVPEAVAYFSKVVGRELPQPVPRTPAEEPQDDEGDDELEEGASRQPRVRGRSPIFEHGQRSIASLMSDIERKVIALPDLQRPFVWEDTKVRDLLDSLFLGFPVGTLVLWHTSSEKEARALGAEKPELRATTLVIDGQQRLTSLFAVMRGQEVVRKDGSKERITIAFRPRDGRFEVADAAIRRDPEFLANVTDLLNGTRTNSQIRRDLINGLRDRGRAIDDEYQDAAEQNLERARMIAEYRFPTVDIRKTAAKQAEEATEVDVAEIFVRINNQGTRLGQADFVLTLLSVFHGQLRDRIELSARTMSAGAVVGLDTQQLLRAACGVAFDRARMSAVYRYLRGVDPTSGESDAASQAERLRQLDDAATECMQTTPWRDYLLRVKHAGFVSPALIGSKNAIVNAYALYIRGRRVPVPRHELDEVIARWVFGALLSARYSTASETAFEQDLARVARLEPHDSQGFVRTLDAALGETITGDYWTHTLVSGLETQKGRAPGALAFRAAQIVLGARALFSDQLLQNMLDPPAQGGRAASEVHHLFPEAWLRVRETREKRRINQVANLADVGWYDNGVIGGRGPAEYVPKLRDRLKIDDDQWGRMCAEHALPLGWESMQYEAFLTERRIRMAEIIRVAFRKLGGEADAQPVTPPWFLPGAETVWQHIAETERALRVVVRDVFRTCFSDSAARKIEDALPERERESLARSLRSRPAGADPLTIVDFLYLKQLAVLLANQWQDARGRFGSGPDAKQRLQLAVDQIAPVRNEIAHVREVDRDRLLRADLACGDVLKMIRGAA